MLSKQSSRAPRTSTRRGAAASAAGPAPWPPRKQRVTCVFWRSDCERKSADETQRSPTSTRPSALGAAGSKAAAARRSGTMKVRGRQGRGSERGQKRKLSPSASPKVQPRASCPGRPQWLQVSWWLARSGAVHLAEVPPRSAGVAAGVEAGSATVRAACWPAPSASAAARAERNDDSRATFSN